jgi:hypothetical protein
MPGLTPEGGIEDGESTAEDVAGIDPVVGLLRMNVLAKVQFLNKKLECFPIMIPLNYGMATVFLDLGSHSREHS